MGQSIVILQMECVYVWARWFALKPNLEPSNFLIVYVLLKRMGIEFPVELKYFPEKSE